MKKNVYPYFSVSETFLVRGPLWKIWWSTKDKILIYIGMRGPLQQILRTTSGPRSRLWESLPYFISFSQIWFGLSSDILTFFRGFKKDAQTVHDTIPMELEEKGKIILYQLSLFSWTWQPSALSTFSLSS